MIYFTPYILQIVHVFLNVNFFINIYINIYDSLCVYLYEKFLVSEVLNNGV